MGDLDGAEHPKHGDGQQRRGQLPELLERAPPFDGSELLDLLDSIGDGPKPGLRAALLDATSAYTREKLREQGELRLKVEQKDQVILELRDQLAQSVTDSAVLRKELEWTRGTSIKNKMSIAFGSAMLPVAVGLFEIAAFPSLLIGAISLACIGSGIWVTRSKKI